MQSPVITIVMITQTWNYMVITKITRGNRDKGQLTKAAVADQLSGSASSLAATDLASWKNFLKWELGWILGCCVVVLDKFYTTLHYPIYMYIYIYITWNFYSPSMNQVWRGFHQVLFPIVHVWAASSKNSLVVLAEITQLGKSLQNGKDVQGQLQYNTAIWLWLMLTWNLRTCPVNKVSQCIRMLCRCIRLLCLFSTVSSTGCWEAHKHPIL